MLNTGTHKKGQLEKLKKEEKLYKILGSRKTEEVYRLNKKTPDETDTQLNNNTKKHKKLDNTVWPMLRIRSNNTLCIYTKRSQKSKHKT